MSPWGRLTRKARWWWWRVATARRLAAAGIDLVVEGDGTPSFGRPPEIELSRDGTAPPEGTRGRLTLRLGPNSHLGSGTIFELRPRGSGTLQLDANAYLHGPVRLVLLDGGEVVLREWAGLRSGAVVRCSGGRVELGRRVPVSYGCVIHCSNRVTLQDDSGVAERCSLIDSDHSHDGSQNWFLEQPVVIGEVVLGENSFVAAGALVLRDARVGRDSIVAANSVVRGGEYPPSSLLAGAPARVVRTLAPEEAPAL